MIPDNLYDGGDLDSDDDTIARLLSSVLQHRKPVDGYTTDNARVFMGPNRRDRVYIGRRAEVLPASHVAAERSAVVDRGRDYIGKRTTSLLTD